MSAVLNAVEDPDDNAEQLTLEGFPPVREFRWSLKSANAFGTAEHLRFMQPVRFAGSGRVTGLKPQFSIPDEHGVSKNTHKLVYEIEAVSGDLDPTCRHCGKDV